MKFVSTALALSLLIPLVGCDDDVDEDIPSGTEGSSNGSDPGTDPGEAPDQAAVDGCRDACDRLQTFDCVDASGHEICWNACAERSESDLELFESCVSNTAPTCDPGCLDSLLDAAEPDPSTTTGGDSSACEDACQAYVDAGCAYEFGVGVTTCAQLCATLSPPEQAIVGVCLGAAENCEVNPECVVEEEEMGADETG